MTASTSADIRALFDYDQAALRCPHAIFAELRREQPVHFVPEFGDAGVYVVTRHADIEAVLLNTEVFRSRTPFGPPPPGLTETVMELVKSNPDYAQALSQTAQLPPVLLLADEPDHRRHRNLIARAFAARAANEQEPIVRAAAHEIIDTFIDDGEIDFVTQFAHPLPIVIMSDLLGIDRRELPRFKAWSVAFLSANLGFRPDEAAVRRILESQIEFWDFMQAEIASRRERPRADLLSQFVQATAEGEAPLTDIELLAIMIQLVTAGTESTNNVLANAMLLLLTSPDLLMRAQGEPSNLGSIVEEILRVETPLRGLFRNVVTDTELAGVPIPANSLVWLAFASANRDPDQFSDPDEFQIDRDPRELRKHLAFGKGVHACVGANLGRVEVGVALQVLLERLADITLVPDQDLTYNESFIVNTPTNLRIRFARR
jgi:cytochrome P450